MSICGAIETLTTRGYLPKVAFQLRGCSVCSTSRRKQGKLSVTNDPNSEHSHLIAPRAFSPPVAKHPFIHQAQAVRVASVATGHGVSAEHGVAGARALESRPAWVVYRRQHITLKREPLHDVINCPIINIDLNLSCLTC
uniref:Uncharacterized protein n=1 Tax=Steinernema glaseri TaxID=37863 RepID=A0A1I7YXI3_9BILA